MTLQRSRYFAIGVTILVTVTLLVSVFLPRQRQDKESDFRSDLDEAEIALFDPERMDESSFSYASQVVPFVNRHCIDCHSGEKPKGGIDLSFRDEAGAMSRRMLWEKCADVLRTNRMPPPDRPRPDPTETESLIQWADRIASGPITPGRVTLRRLNRAEYTNTIRDLFGIAIVPAADFPIDDSGNGFDTNADVLSLSPTLMEKYLSAAERIVETAARDFMAWRRLTETPPDDFVPFVLRGQPPLRDPANKGTRFEAGDEEVQSRQIEFDRAYASLQAFADRAFRRPIRHDEMARLMRFVESAQANGETIELGFKRALQAILISPHFLFRVELDSHPDRPNQDGRLTDYELATRLSYFLWSAPPDESLFRLAASHRLREPRTMIAQIRRMLQDPKSQALAEHFAGQWLQTRALGETTRDPGLFPQFDDELRRSMQKETELVFDGIVREDRSILEFLNGESTFLNERLAKHYGIPGIEGPDFRRVSLAGTNRAGILTHASVLTITSEPTRTSPVKRGKWILDTILGTPTPPPPPGVDGLKPSEQGQSTSMRDQLSRHRERSECASCHARIDPLGFGLENFDAVGVWRERDGHAAIDASGTLINGQTFRGPSELRQALTSNPRDFTRCLAEKLFTYSLGRGVRPADRPAIDRIVRHSLQSNHTFSSLIVAIVASDPFRKRDIALEGTNP